MKLHSKSFWEAVLKDYSSQLNVYICHASDLFKHEWGHLNWDYLAADSGADDSVVYFRGECRNICRQLGFYVPVSLSCSALIMDGPDGPEFEPRLKFINHMISISTEP